MLKPDYIENKPAIVTPAKYHDCNKNKIQFEIFQNIIVESTDYSLSECLILPFSQNMTTYLLGIYIPELYLQYSKLGAQIPAIPVQRGFRASPGQSEGGFEKARVRNTIAVSICTRILKYRV